MPPSPSGFCRAPSRGTSPSRARSTEGGHSTAPGMSQGWELGVHPKAETWICFSFLHGDSELLLSPSLEAGDTPSPDSVTPSRCHLSMECPSGFIPSTLPCPCLSPGFLEAEREGSGSSCAAATQRIPPPPAPAEQSTEPGAAAAALIPGGIRRKRAGKGQRKIPH